MTLAWGPTSTPWLCLNKCLIEGNPTSPVEWTQCSLLAVPRASTTHVLKYRAVPECWMLDKSIGVFALSTYPGPIYQAASLILPPTNRINVLWCDWPGRTHILVLNIKSGLYTGVNSLAIFTHSTGIYMTSKDLFLICNSWPTLLSTKLCPRRQRICSHKWEISLWKPPKSLIWRLLKFIRHPFKFGNQCGWLQALT